MASVQLLNFSKKFGDVIAVQDLSLTVQDGEFFSLLGPSGCGKSTVLRIIAGFCIPTAGNVAFCDRDVSALPPNKRNTGMVFQNYALFPHMTVFENVAFGLRARKVPKPEQVERVSNALELVDLPGLEKRRVTQLSGGELQKVSVARALVQEPHLLLLDEPTSFLDLKNQIEILKILRRVVDEHRIAAVMTMHDLNTALRYAHRFLFLKDHMVFATGHVEEITPEMIEEVYEVPVRIQQVDGYPVVVPKS